MASTALDKIRQDALVRRVKGGGNCIEWSAKDLAVIRDHIAAMSDHTIRAAPRKPRRDGKAHERGSHD